MLSTSSPRAAGVALALALVASAVGVARAQEPTGDDDAARLHFRVGQAQYDAGQYAAAAAEFEQAYALSHRAELFYNVYVSYREIGDLDRASAALRQYLATNPDATNAAQLRVRLEAMERQIAERDAGRPVPTDAEALESASAETERAPIDVPTSPAEPSTQPSPIGFVVMGTGAAMLIASAVTGGLALSQYGALEQQCGADHACPAGFEGDRDTGAALSTATDVLWIGGAVLAATGLVLALVLTEPSSADAVPLTAGCDATGCRASLRLRF